MEWDEKSFFLLSIQKKKAPLSSLWRQKQPKSTNEKSSCSLCQLVLFFIDGKFCFLLNRERAFASGRGKVSSTETAVAIVCPVTRKGDRVVVWSQSKVLRRRMDKKAAMPSFSYSREHKQTSLFFCAHKNLLLLRLGPILDWSNYPHLTRLLFSGLWYTFHSSLLAAALCWYIEFIIFIYREEADGMMSDEDKINNLKNKNWDSVNMSSSWLRLLLGWLADAALHNKYLLLYHLWKYLSTLW